MSRKGHRLSSNTGIFSGDGTYNPFVHIPASQQAHIQNTADHLSTKTHFTSEECRSLLIMFNHLTSGTGKLDRLGLRDFMFGCFDITHDVMLDFLYRAFDSTVLEHTGTGIDEIEFVYGLSRLIRGNMDEQIEFCYSVFDINGDGSIAREELGHCLRGSILPGYGIELEDIEEAEKEIVEICMKKLDVNKDGHITKDDFGKAVQKEPLLLQAIGPCLPDPKAMSPFLALITENHRTYSAIWTAPNLPTPKYNVSSSKSLNGLHSKKSSPFTTGGSGSDSSPYTSKSKKRSSSLSNRF